MKEQNNLTIKPALVDMAGAAAYMGTTIRHIRGLWFRREIPAIKVGHLVRFKLEDLDAYIKEHRVEAVQ